MVNRPPTFSSRKKSRGLIAIVIVVVAATLLVANPDTASAELTSAECFALPDNASELYILQLDTSNPGPVTIVDLANTYGGEGMAYDPLTGLIYAFRGSNDKEMWSIDPLTGDELRITSNFDDNFNNLDEVQGASVAYDRATQISTLHVLVDISNQFYVYEVDPATGNAANPVGPITGTWSNPASLGIDPTDGAWYVTRDSGTRRIGSLDPTTAVITSLSNIAGNPDAEGLDFADDGQMYIEEDRGSLGGRHIYQLDPDDGSLSVATQTIPGTGDIEGISCNANRTVALNPCLAIGDGSGGTSSATVNLSANVGDVDVTQLVMNHEGSTFIYNTSATSIRDGGSSVAAVESVRIDDNGASIRLDHLNFSAADVANINYPGGVLGVATSENGVRTSASESGFETALERVYNGADLRDYLDQTSASPVATTWGADYGVTFDNPLDNDDYVLAFERDGNSDYVVEALDFNGYVIDDSHAIRVSSGYRWNTGYAPSDEPTEPMWMTVFDVEQFNVDTLLTPIYGFRVDDDSGAQLKLIGASDQAFTTPLGGGGQTAIQSGTWTGGGFAWSAPFGSGTVSAVLSSPPGTITEIGAATMDTSTYSDAGVSASPAFFVTHAHGTNATLSFDFGREVTDPVLHLGRIGGYSGSPSQSHSSYLELGGGLTWTKLAANDTHFMTTPNAVWREAGTVLDWRKTGEIGGPTWGTVAGSMRIDGTVSSITMTITNALPMGVEDLIEFVWTGVEVLPPPAPTSGCGEVTAIKSVSSSVVPIGGSVDWYLDTQSTGAVDVRNLQMTDSIPPQLSATHLYTGAWTPIATQAQMDVKVAGVWQAVGTFDGDDEATYALPGGVEEVRAVFVGDVAVDFAMSNPMRVTTEVINPDRDGVTHTLPITVQNCAGWVGDNIADERQCASISVADETARPDVSVWSESTNLAPGDVASFRIRIENTWAGSEDLLDPFLANLLPAEFEYVSWSPITLGFMPVLTNAQDHDGTGRDLLRWNFDGHSMAPGDIFDLRVFAAVRAGTAAGDHTNSVLGGTNNSTNAVVCGGTTDQDVNDLDGDGDRLEALCSDSTESGTAVVPAVGSVVGSVTAEGTSGLLNIDLLTGQAGQPGVPTNLALAATATQSSTRANAVAERAVDGSTNGDHFAGSVTQTAPELHPYLDLDLGSIEEIEEIVLWNRTDCCSSRLSDVWIFASDTPFASTSPSTLDADPSVLSVLLGGAQATETHVATLGVGTSGTVKAEQKISNGGGGLSLTIPEMEEFGTSTAGIGDLDGDGVEDVVVGAPNNDDGDDNTGAIYVLFLNSDGTVKAEQKISNTPGGLARTIPENERFGTSVASLGDLDGDGIVDIVVGAAMSEDGEEGAGALYVLFLNTDGTVRDEQKISNTSGGLGPVIPEDEEMGTSVAGIGDLDGDGVEDLVAGAAKSDDGDGHAGAVYVMFLNIDGTVKGSQKISSTRGGFGIALSGHEHFGSSVTGVGDLDGDGFEDIVVGARSNDDGDRNAGAAYVLFLNQNGTVKSSQKISNTAGGLGLAIPRNEQFASSIASVGDLDGDGVTDIVVGAPKNDDGSQDSGAVYVLFLKSDGTVKSSQKISNAGGGLSLTIPQGEQFGVSIGGIGDIDGDGAPDIVVGANKNDDGAQDTGAVYIINLNQRSSEAISARYIRVQLDGTERLSLAELQVFGPTPTSNCLGMGPATYSCAAQATSNSSAVFDYSVENIGNVAADGFVMVAMLPQVGDVGLTGPAPHPSEWTGWLESAVTVTDAPAGATVTVTYSQSLNPCRPELNGLASGVAWPAGCSDDWGPLPPELTDVTALRADVTFDGPIKWVGGEALGIRANVQVGQGSPDADQLGLSSFGYSVDVASTGDSLGIVETDPGAILIPRSTNGIGDLVWNDSNDDGIQDPGETGRNGVTVQLYHQGGDLVATVVTGFLNNDPALPGRYWFGDLPAGNYYVQFPLLADGLNSVTPRQGHDTARDSDANPGNMKTPNIIMAPGVIDLTIDAGYFVPAGPIECDSSIDEFDPTDTNADRRQVNDPRPCPG